MDRSVGNRGQLLIVGQDDEGLTKLVSEVEEELMELCLVLTIE